MLQMNELDLTGKRVMIRQDLNVPVEDGEVRSDARIRAALPTIEQALEKGAAVIVLSHLGRPVEGQPEQEFSLEPVARCLSRHLGQSVRLQTDWLEGFSIEPGEVVLCENVRFNVGEKANDEALAARMAGLCDVFVMDAFGTAHRAQASTEGIIHKTEKACAGPLLVKELDALGRGLENPARPLLAIVGGSKVSTKLSVLESLIQQVDTLIVGGGIANTLLAATGKPVGQSLYEPDLLEDARGLLQLAEDQNTDLPLPRDVVVATEFSRDASPETIAVTQVAENQMILDVGPETARLYATLVRNAGTVLWNGPLGVFEFPAFEEGTRVLAEAIASSDAFSIAGGGDTLAAIDQFGVRDGLSYISTGGGAFLEYLEGKGLPAIAALKSRS